MENSYLQGNVLDAIANRRGHVNTGCCLGNESVKEALPPGLICSSACAFCTHSAPPAVRKAKKIIVVKQSRKINI